MANLEKVSKDATYYDQLNLIGNTQFTFGLDEKKGCFELCLK